MGMNRKISKAQQKFENEISDKSFEIAKKIQVKKDMIIVEAITHAVGNDTWKMDDPEIIKRGEFRVQPDGSQIFYFDDISMVLFKTPKAVIEEEGKKNYFEAGFECAKLWEIREKENATHK